jgi:hypothetical protein
VRIRFEIIRYLCEKVQSTVCSIYMACSHVPVLLPQYADVTLWPCAVMSPPAVQNCNNVRDLLCESLLQQAVSEATTQKEQNPQQEQIGFLRKNGAALYEQRDAQPGSHATEPRHRAYVNGATRKWREKIAYRIDTTKCRRCLLLAFRMLLYSCCVLLFKFAQMFHIEFYCKFFLGDRLQKSDLCMSQFWIWGCGVCVCVCTRARVYIYTYIHTHMYI